MYLSVVCLVPITRHLDSGRGGGGVYCICVMCCVCICCVSLYIIYCYPPMFVALLDNLGYTCLMLIHIWYMMWQCVLLCDTLCYCMYCARCVGLCIMYCVALLCRLLCSLLYMLASPVYLLIRQTRQCIAARGCRIYCYACYTYCTWYICYIYTRRCYGLRGMVGLTCVIVIHVNALMCYCVTYATIWYGY